MEIGKVGEPLVKLIVDPRVDFLSFILALIGAYIRQKFAEIVTSTTDDLVGERIFFRQAYIGKIMDCLDFVYIWQLKRGKNLQYSKVKKQME